MAEYLLGYKNVIKSKNITSSSKSRKYGNHNKMKNTFSKRIGRKCRLKKKKKKN